MNSVKFEMSCRLCARRCEVYGNLATILDDERCTECGGRGRLVTCPAIPVELEDLIEIDEYGQLGARMLGVDFLGNDRAERLAIASICRCARMDEAGRIRKKWPNPDEKMDDEDYADIQRLDTNAMEWLEWGSK